MGFQAADAFFLGRIQLSFLNGGVDFAAELTVL
jgi:hypothetical protein